MFRTKNTVKNISRELENLINDVPLKPPASKDTLPAKVQHQLMRLSDKMRGNEEKLSRERDEIKGLISEIAHQLRNPLANMESYIELLKDTSCDREEQILYLAAIEAAEERIRFLTEGFIKMARLESRVIQIKKESMNLKETILQSVIQAESAAEKKSMYIDLVMEGDLQVCHDANWLSEAVFNLLDNSIKYSPEESQIHISVTKNEMFVQIAVRDYGMGIEAEEENLIFQRFYRGKKVTTQEGFGLGLYLAREIVMHHDGFMKAKREEKGLRISIYLPV